ncbi:helix-turn-helix transcriptional regulator [Streptomyces sp. MP131-18]|uniref:helix-turn-helix domain-containing protein n=1 Tax=Streptomyces sp. MP131-18 TaxID=1857892 RepID=UPI00097BF15D|nr:helix-turn-helix transcriptional regulator [Streptomyces sp. MP131-18]ONK09899.1 putative transcriptional regulator [Streptomyces sp. MP131-18]
MRVSRSGRPTAALLLIGARLRELRAAAGLSAREAADELGTSPSTLHRMEGGRVGLKPAHVRRLLTVYGREAEAGSVLADVERASRPGWWQAYRDVLPRSPADLIGLEEHAQVIRFYAPAVVPDLLQTPAYAEALQRVQHPEDADGRIARRVELLNRRQAVLDRAEPAPPVLWALIEEAALRRRVGGPEVMRGQLAHLRRLAGRPGVTIRVVPMRTLHTALMCGPVQLLRYRPAGLPDRVLLHTLDGTEVNEAQDAVTQYLIALDSAASVPDSAPITEWRTEWEDPRA